MTQPTLSLGVLGLGRVGTCLARALYAAGQRLTAVASTRVSVASELAEELGRDVIGVDAAALAQHAELIFVTVPDARLPELSAGTTLAGAHALVHTSGAQDLSVWDAARARGSRTGLWHPLQAFPRGADPARFRGIHVGLEADDAQLEGQLTTLAHALGASAFSLRGVDRGAYHAAAVFASNYAVALHVAAERIWSGAGLPVEIARTALAPLTLGAARAIAEHPLHAALTGPLARGDVSTLARHIEALRAEPAIARLYAGLARQLLALPLGLDAEARTAIERLLVEEPAAREP